MLIKIFRSRLITLKAKATARAEVLVGDRDNTEGLWTLKADRRREPPLLPSDV